MPPPTGDVLAAIHATLASYCQSCDDGRFEDFAELFTPDATFTVLGRTHVGRDEIAAFMAKAQPPEARGRHMISVPLVEFDEASPDTAAAATDYTFTTATPDGGYQVTSVGRYRDTLRRDDDGRWRFVSREIVFLPEPGAGSP